MFGRRHKQLPSQPVQRLQTADIAAALQNSTSGLTITEVIGDPMWVANGMLLGMPFKLEKSGLQFTLSVGGDFRSVPLYQAVDTQSSDGLDSALVYTDAMRRLIGNLQRASRLWEFEGVVPSGLYVGERDIYPEWGSTPEEAFEKLLEPYRKLGAKLHATEDESRCYDLLSRRRIKPSTITVDDRVWPDPEPDFAALAAGRVVV